MEIIKNENLLKSYVKRYSIDSFFSFYDKYEVKLVRFSKGEIICSKNNKLNEILFIVEGCLKIYYISAEGKVLYLDFKNPIALLGEMEFAGESDTPYAQCLDEVMAISISIDKHRDLLNEDLLFCRYIIKSLAQKISLSSKNTFLNSLHSKEIRLAFYLLTNEKEEKVCGNWTEIASLLNFSYRQLMRLLTKFCDEKIIKRANKKGAYEIIDKEKLKNICEDIFI